MQSLINFVKRNAPVFFLGLIITLVFLAIILTQPNVNKDVPAGFKKVEEVVFNDREPINPTPEPQPQEYAPQIPSPENKGKPYFRGEYNPNLRDSEGYPIPPPIGSTYIAPNLPEEERNIRRGLELERYRERMKPTSITFTTDGFSPENTKGFTGREVIWTNNTANEIKIIETTPVHEALKNGVVIKPGESFSFKPLTTKIFTYMEVNSKKYGSVSVADITTPLLGNSVEN